MKDRTIGWACAGCMEFWVRGETESECRDKLDKHDDNVHGGCRCTYVPVRQSMLDENGDIFQGDHFTSVMDDDGVWRTKAQISRRKAKLELIQ